VESLDMCLPEILASTWNGASNLQQDKLQMDPNCKNAEPEETWKNVAYAKWKRMNWKCAM